MLAFIIISSDEGSKSCMFWVFREKETSQYVIQNFIKVPHITFKTTTLCLYLEQELHSDEMCSTG